MLRAIAIWGGVVIGLGVVFAVGVASSRTADEPANLPPLVEKLPDYPDEPIVFNPPMPGDVRDLRAPPVEPDYRADGAPSRKLPLLPASFSGYPAPSIPS